MDTAIEYENLKNIELYQKAESKTNRDNVICLIVLTGIMLICEFLNEIKVFSVAPLVMRIGIASGIICYIMPVIILFRPMKLFSRDKQNLEYKRWHKFLILAFLWLGTVAASITLTHHTVILMAIPIMVMAQYRNSNKLILVTLLLATICVFLGVYGGYFWGCFDGNLLNLRETASNVADLSLRTQIASMARMKQLFSHYVLPRELVVIALTFLATKISKRNDERLNQQAQLQLTVEMEMQRTNRIQEQIIDGMANLIENRDISTGEHVKRTSYYVKKIVKQLQKNSLYSGDLTEQKANTIVKAAPLHDIGKIVVPDRILQKPGKLTPQEYEEIKLHASEGAKVIRSVLGNIEDENFISTAIEIAAGHHEHWDGNGYPEGVIGKNIPLSSRIMAVADVFDALVSKRVYKEPMTPDEAFLIIENESGKQFDPEVVKAFLSLKPDIYNYLKNICNDYAPKPKSTV